MLFAHYSCCTLYLSKIFLYLRKIFRFVCSVRLLSLSGFLPETQDSFLIKNTGRSSHFDPAAEENLQEMQDFLANFVADRNYQHFLLTSAAIMQKQWKRVLLFMPHLFGVRYCRELPVDFNLLGPESHHIFSEFIVLSSCLYGP